MRNLFSMDGGIARFLTRMADLMILNLCFLLSCIPIITIGAALTGLNYVARQMAAGEESYIMKNYWKSFRQNFKQATVIWLIMALIAGILGCDMYILSQLNGLHIQICRVLIGMIIFVWIMVFLFVFPILARFDNTIKNTIKNAFFMAIADFPKAILIILVTVGSGFVTLLNDITWGYGLLAWLVIGFSLIAMINHYQFQKIFARYIPDEDQKDPDDWTVV